MTPKAATYIAPMTRGGWEASAVLSGKCIICGKYLPLRHEHVDTCSKRCFKRLLARQRKEPC